MKLAFFSQSTGENTTEPSTGKFLDIERHCMVNYPETGKSTKSEISLNVGLRPHQHVALLYPKRFVPRVSVENLTWTRNVFIWMCIQKLDQQVTM